MATDAPERLTIAAAAALPLISGMNKNFPFAALLVAFTLSACKPERVPGHFPAPVVPAATNAVAPGAFGKILGRWERPDGGYILELKSVDAAGKIAARYFNPSPINVETAAAMPEGKALKVFVVLRDVNYPGCTYKLTYDPKSDQLFGQYFQASLQETYEVTFARQQ